MPFYLAFKELWRARGRYILFRPVIALITLLVLFVAALAEGLGSGNREYVEKLNADLLVYQANVDLNVGASRIGAARLNEVRRVPGVKAVGPIATSNGSVMLEGGRKPLGVALIGVEPGQPGEPSVVTGEGLRGRRAKEAVIDRQVALRAGLKAGDTLVIKTIQDTKEQYYTLRVAGVTDNRQYSLQPTIILPIRTWDEIRPQAVVGGVPDAEIVANVVAVRAGDPTPEGVQALALAIEGQVQDAVAVDRVTAYEATPGYSAQQSTLNTQKYFALIIGVLVIGGFFQILTLQKVPQIGTLKAIGASNATVGLAAVVQIIAVTVIGVSIGAAATLLLSLGFPPTIPIVFSPGALAASIASLLLIGPMGGLVSVGY
jgi:putative ABC transport system permease protein